MSKEEEKAEAKIPEKSKVPLEAPDARYSPEMKAKIAFAEKEAARKELAKIAEK